MQHTLNKAYFLVESSRLFKPSIDLGLAGEVFQLSGGCERWWSGPLILDRQRLVQSNVHLVDEVDIQLAQKRLQQ